MGPVVGDVTKDSVVIMMEVSGMDNTIISIDVKSVIFSNLGPEKFVTLGCDLYKECETSDAIANYSKEARSKRRLTRYCASAR